MDNKRIKNISEFLLLVSSYLKIEDAYLLFENDIIQKNLKVLGKDTQEQIKSYLLKFPSDELNELRSILAYKNKNEDIFILAEKYLSDEANKKLQGAVFTPKWLAQIVTERTIEHYKKEFDSHPTKVGDLSCGSGIFLSQLSKILPESSNIYGNDINREFIFAAKLLNDEEHITFCNKDTLIDLNMEDQISLFEKDNNFKNGEFDLIVGNPPYVRSQLLEEKYIDSLKNIYGEYLEGNFDLTIPFMINTFNLLKPNGFAGFIVSNKFLTSKYGKKLCNLLAKKTKIIEIIDFGDTQVFKGKTTYTCVIIFQKTGYNPTLEDNLISITSFDSGITWDSVGSSMKKANKSQISQSKLFIHPWRLNSEIEECILQLLDKENTTVSINKVFPKIIQGVRTGANKIFILNEKNKKLVETDILKEFIDGTNIRSLSIQGEKKYIIWPYELKDEKVQVRNIPVEKYPYFHKYMNMHKETLSSRKMDDNEKFYQFSRSQNIAHMFESKILIREMMPSIQIAADPDGKYAFSSGYALISNGMSKEMYLFWEMVFNTPIMEYQFRKKTTQLHSGWFRVLKNHLLNLRLPIFSEKEIKTVILEIKNKKINNFELVSKLNDMIINKLGLSEEMVNYINDYLKKSHEISHASLNLDISSQNLVDDINQINVDNIHESYYKDLSIDKRLKYLPVEITKFNKFHVNKPELNKLVTFQKNKGDVPIHNWYHYTQGYSKDLIKFLLEQLEYEKNEKVFDPFVGSGTTLLACKELGIESIGTDISPLMTWITNLKVHTWNIKKLKNLLENIDFSCPKHAEIEDMIFTNYLLKAYSPKILSQILGWKTYVETLNCSNKEKDFIMLGLISILEEISLIRKHGSHYRFLNKEDNVGVNKLNIKTIDENITINPILKDKLWKMLSDIRKNPLNEPIKAKAFTMNARNNVPSEKVKFVITSPPYLNRNNYFSQQKAELSITGILESEKQYKELVKASYKSHVEAAFKKEVVSDIPEVNEILNKVKLADNNNPKIPHMICGYFDDLRETLFTMKSILKPGAKLAFVVGNSRWGGVVVPVDHLLALIAERLGYKLEKILVARYKGNSPQQMAKYGRIPVRESVVILRLI